MGMFGNLTDTTQMEKATDSVGGGGQRLPSGVYDLKIKALYAGQSKGGASNLTIVADADGTEVSETIYYTNKKGENFYLDKNDKTKRHPLPGFTTVNDICLVVTGKPLAEQDVEEKVVNIFDFESRKDIATPVQCITAAHGETFKAGILRVIEDKNEKNDAGDYVPTGKTYTTNAIDKVFQADDDRTVVEVLNGVESAEFLTAWLERNKGKDRDKSSKKAGNDNAGASGDGRPGAGNQDQAPKNSLFAKG